MFQSTYKKQRLKGGGDETIKMKEGTRERNGKMRKYSAPEGKVDV
jgi:hypothetical protein